MGEPREPRMGIQRGTAFTVAFEVYEKLKQPCLLSLKQFQVLPYFKKSESQTGRYRDDLQFHGSDGPLNVRDSIFVSPLSALYAIMAEKFGFDVHDINGKVQAGYDVPQVFIISFNKHEQRVIEIH